MQRNVHQIDATDQKLGRLATKIASLLRGKHKVTFQPNIDGGDIVEVAFLMELEFLNGRDRLDGYDIFSLIID